MRPLKNTTGATVGSEGHRNMKTRILAAAVLVPLLLIILLALPKIVTTIVFALMMAISAYELLYRTGLVRHVRLVIWSALMAVAVSLWSYFDAVHDYAVIGILLFMIALFGEMMYDHVKVHFDMLAMCMVAGLVIPYLLTSLIRILDLKLGRYLILVPFAVAFLSDAGAYFVGLRFGKHKLAPVVSPNKTIEGVLGGLATSMIGMLIYGVVLQLLSFQVNYGLALLYGLLGSAAATFGDLCFSIIKRQTAIKDYGNLIPGHGGVLDRFDSMMTVAPLIEVLLSLLPFAVAR